MPEPPDARSPFEYAIVRVVPRVERGEAFNAGIVLMCRPLRFLGARVELDEAALAALSPDCDAEVIREHLAVVTRIAEGDPSGGPIAALQAGDVIDIDLTERRLEVRLSAEEIESRLAALPSFQSNVKSKWLKRYSHFVTSADTGAVLQS